jgi:uncharacterized protein
MREILGGLTPQRWDKLAARHFYSSSAWLRMCALQGSPPGTAVVAELDDEAIAAVPVTIASKPLRGNYDWNGILRARGLPHLGDCGLLVGPAGGYQTHLLGDIGDRRVIQEVVHSLRARAKDGAAGDSAACVAMYLSTGDVRRFREAGVMATPVLLEPDVWFHIPAGGWEAWLASLSGTVRHRVRRDVARFDAMGYQVSRQPLGECAGRLPPLAVELALKLGYDPSPDRFAREFADYAEIFGDAAQVVLGERPDGALIGFCMYLIWGDTVYLRWSAFDYPRLSGKGAEYFNLGYYQQIHLAADVGGEHLHAGKKAVEAKVLRGGRLYPLWLLDLAEDSPHSQQEQLIRAHNAKLLAQLEADSRTAGAIADRAQWAAFC